MWHQALGKIYFAVHVGVAPSSRRMLTSHWLRGEFVRGACLHDVHSSRGTFRGRRLCGIWCRENMPDDAFVASAGLREACLRGISFLNQLAYPIGMVSLLLF